MNIRQPTTATILALACVFTGATATARQTPRASEPPAATAERDAQLAPMPQGKSDNDAATPSAPAKPSSEAQRRDGRVRDTAPPPPDPKADARPAPGQSAQTRRAPPRRRAVEQILTPTPRILGSATPPPAGPLTYGPTLTAPPAPPSTISAPSTISTNPAVCSGGSCFDSSGQRLGTGIGNTAVTPQGRLCTQGLAGVQCF
jgi:hypothetical protein